MTSAIISCSVCLLELEEHMVAHCNACGQAYHLNQRNDRPGTDCGEVWVNEEHLALEFACNTCLHPPVEETLSAVLDTAEAAALAGLSEAALQAAADAGLVRSRRTSSGIYLFERGDVIAFARGRP